MSIAVRARSRTLPVLALLTALLAGCAGHGGARGDYVFPSSNSDAGPENPLREAIIENALGQVGRPYRYGGADPSGFDCSGLVQYSYLQAGLKIPRYTSAQLDAGSRIELTQLKPGDLLFYTFSEKAFPSLHVGIYLGDAQMVHSPASGRQVSVVRVDQPPWPERFVQAVRFLP